MAKINVPAYIYSILVVTVNTHSLLMKCLFHPVCIRLWDKWLKIQKETGTFSTYVVKGYSFLSISNVTVYRSLQQMAERNKLQDVHFWGNTCYVSVILCYLLAYISLQNWYRHERFILMALIITVTVLFIIPSSN